jgi:hypothetical protein
MRSVVAALLVTISVAGAAAQQTPRADPSKDSQNTSGRTIIPEKMGAPLRRGLTSSDVKLKPRERLNLPSAPHAPARPAPKQQTQ